MEDDGRVYIDISAHFCETMRSTAVWMRKNDFIWRERERERKLGRGRRNTEEVCPVNTVIMMSYLITVWTRSKEGSIQETTARLKDKYDAGEGGEEREKTV